MQQSLFSVAVDTHTHTPSLSLSLSPLPPPGQGLDPSGPDGEKIIGVHFIRTEGLQNHQVLMWWSVCVSPHLFPPSTIKSSLFGVLQGFTLEHQLSHILQLHLSATPFHPLAVVGVDLAAGVE